jgi:ATP phosphoribosyltransferase
MTLYAIRSRPGIRSFDEDAEVVSQSKYGWEFLGQAIMLWRLVDKSRANELEVMKKRISLTAPEEELRIETEDLQELVRLLAGVEDAIVAAGIVDHHWRVPVDRLEELAMQVPAMDLATERPLQSKTNALAEVMINAVSIRNFLENAENAGCVVVLG